MTTPTTTRGDVDSTPHDDDHNLLLLLPHLPPLPPPLALSDHFLFLQGKDVNASLLRRHLFGSKRNRGKSRTDEKLNSQQQQQQGGGRGGGEEWDKKNTSKKGHEKEEEEAEEEEGILLHLSRVQVSLIPPGKRPEEENEGCNEHRKYIDAISTTNGFRNVWGNIIVTTRRILFIATSSSGSGSGNNIDEGKEQEEKENEADIERFDVSIDARCIILHAISSSSSFSSSVGNEEGTDEDQQQQKEEEEEEKEKEQQQDEAREKFPAAQAAKENNNLRRVYCQINTHGSNKNNADVGGDNTTGAGVATAQCGKYYTFDTTTPAAAVSGGVYDDADEGGDNDDHDGEQSKQKNGHQQDDNEEEKMENSGGDDDDGGEENDNHNNVWKVAWRREENEQDVKEGDDHDKGESDEGTTEDNCGPTEVVFTPMLEYSVRDPTAMNKEQDQHQRQQQPQQQYEELQKESCQRLFEALSKLVSLNPIYDDDNDHADDHCYHYHHRNVGLDNNEGGWMFGTNANANCLVNDEMITAWDQQQHYNGQDSYYNDDDDDQDMGATEEEREAMLRRLDNMLVVPPEYEIPSDDDDDRNNDIDEVAGCEKDEGHERMHLGGQFDDADEENENKEDNDDIL